MVFQRKIWGILCSCWLGFALAATSWTAQADVEVVPGEYVVKLKSGHFLMNEDYLIQSLGATEGEMISQVSQAMLIKRDPNEPMENVLSSLSSHPLIEYIEPNFIYTIGGTGETIETNDPELGQLWGLINEGQTINRSVGVPGVDVNAGRAWTIQTGSRDVIVAVIDTGIDTDIPDLKNNLWVNEAEYHGLPQVDDDGNGFVDDIYGYDFVSNRGRLIDDNGHGSHCAGTIGAEGNNGIGISGVAWNVRLMGIKFLSGRGGGSLADAIKSIDYATQMGAHIMSNSWGGGGFSRALKESIERANDAGIIFIAAAGNSSANNDRVDSFPANYDVPNVVSVAAINNKGELARFSSYGATKVHIGAPGVDILSTTPSGLRMFSGTSMATPHVSGVAALLLSNEPDLGMLELKDRLLNTARPVSHLSGRVATGGIVDAYYALTNSEPEPDPNDPAMWEKMPVNISTPHPYPNNFTESWTVEVPGASRLAVHFTRFETEAGYDRVTFKDGDGNIIDIWSGNRGRNVFSPVVQGDTMKIEISTDQSVTAYGFDIDAVAFD